GILVTPLPPRVVRADVGNPVGVLGRSSSGMDVLIAVLVAGEDRAVSGVVEVVVPIAHDSRLCDVAEAAVDLVAAILDVTERRDAVATEALEAGVPADRPAHQNGGSSLGVLT